LQRDSQKLCGQNAGSGDDRELQRGRGALFGAFLFDLPRPARVQLNAQSRFDHPHGRASFVTAGILSRLRLRGHGRELSVHRGRLDQAADGEVQQARSGVKLAGDARPSSEPAKLYGPRSPPRTKCTTLLAAFFRMNTPTNAIRASSRLHGNPQSAVPHVHRGSLRSRWPSQISPKPA
jgi:hypothetical protein